MGVSSSALLVALGLCSVLWVAEGLIITNAKKQITIPKIGTWVGVSE